MIDLNQVASAGREPLRHNLDAIVVGLRGSAATWVPTLFPSGRRVGDQWRLSICWHWSLNRASLRSAVIECTVGTQADQQQVPAHRSPSGPLKTDEHAEEGGQIAEALLDARRGISFAYLWRRPE